MIKIINSIRTRSSIIKSMGGCSSNILSTMIRKYGEDKIMKYIKSTIGGNFIGK